MLVWLASEIPGLSFTLKLPIICLLPNAGGVNRADKMDALLRS